MTDQTKQTQEQEQNGKNDQRDVIIEECIAWLVEAGYYGAARLMRWDMIDKRKKPNG